MAKKCFETIKECRTELMRLSDDGYREFIMRGIPGEPRPFLGVRIPQIREIAKLVNRCNFDNILSVEPVTFEEVILRGFLLARLSYAEMLPLFDSQVEYTENWCTCDTFVAALRPVVRGHLGEFLDAKIEPLLHDKREYAVRVGLVALLDFYVSFDYLFVIFDKIDELAVRKEYYIRMALAWLTAECFIKFPEETGAYLAHSALPKWTFNKTISKICDSRRVDAEVKEWLRGMRK